MNQSNYCFTCSICEFSTSPSSQVIICKKCNSPLDVKYASLDKSKTVVNSIDIPLPITSEDLISLGEGNTPTISLNNLSDNLDVRLSTKLEQFYRLIQRQRNIYNDFVS